MSVKVSFKDLGLGRIMAGLQEAAETRVKVGIVGAAAEQPSSHGDLTLGDVAVLNEYGSDDGHVPARATFRRVGQGDPIVRQLTNWHIERVIDGVPVEQSADLMGDAMAEHLRNMIDEGVDPPNAPSTVRQKGFDHPLVETGELRAAISHQVVRGGQVLEAGSAIGDFESFEVEGGVSVGGAEGVSGGGED